MRVVYNLLNPGDQRNANDDSSIIFSLPNSTSATKYPITPGTSNHINTSIITVSSAAIPEILTTSPNASTTPGSSNRIRTRKIKKGASSISNSNSRNNSGRVRTKTAATNKRIQCKAEEILNWLSNKGSVSEVVIRSAFGDTPDTSKSLRLLLKSDGVIRTGVGGRANPFLYRVVSKAAMQNE